MNLDESKKQIVRKWVDEGLKLSEIQSRLSSELGVRMTYMEVRFLLDDLKLKPQDKLPEQPVEIKKDTAPPTAEPLPVDEDLQEPPIADTAPGNGGVSLNVDQIARPGALISGKVTFSDGKSAQWQLDQYGRLGVAPEEKGYKPSQPDLMAFQTELQNALAKMGF